MSESIWDDPRITAYVLGEMSEPELSAFEAEIETSGELAAAIEEARLVTDQLASLYGEESVPVLDQQRRASIVSKAERPRPAGDSSRWLRLTVALATAAVVLIMIGIAPMMMPRRDAQELALQRDQTPQREGAQGQPTPAENARAQEFSVAAEVADAASVEMEEVAERSLSESPVEESVRDNWVVEESEALNRRAVQLRGSRSSTDPSTLSLDTSLQQNNAPASEIPSSAAAAPGQRGRYRVADAAAPLADSPARSATAAGATPATIQPAQPAAASSAPVTRGVDRLSVQAAPVPAGMEAAGGYGGQAPVAKSLSVADSSADESTPFGLAPSTQTAPLPALQELDADVDGLRSEAVAPARPMVDAFGREPADKESLVEAEVRIAERQSESRQSLAEVSAEKRRVLGLQLGKGLPEPGQRGLQADDFALAIDEGRGPGIAGDRFEPITDNPFHRVSEHPLSTFSVDVDTASYSKVRDYLMRANQLPRPDAVRIEEMVNYFSYDYQPPDDGDEHPFAAQVGVTSCPWNEQHRLARIALKGKTMEPEQRPRCNLVFLLDTSGSMNAANKLPLVVEGMKMLLGQLNDDDQVAIAVYAGSAGLVLDSTPAKKEKKIRKALTQLSAGGSTNGGAGIALAYQTARDHFIADGVNRVILCTDGDFNVGTTGTDELVRMVEQEAKGGVFLSVLGFGMGNHNDAMLEQVSGRGNGNYAFIDNRLEAKKVLVEQTSGTLVTIAKDVKLQIEFNPAQVAAYRLIGYENRILAKEDFNDDKKDAGEIGAGHAVTALYEIVPAGVEADAIGPAVDELKYQRPAEPSEAADSEELLTLKLRYKQPDGDTSTLVEFPVVDEGLDFAEADDDVRFAAAVASFGMQLRRSPYAGSWTLSDAMNTANRAKGEDRSGLRAEFVTLVQKASQLMGEE